MKKILTSVLAVMMTAVMAIGLVSCHKQGATVATYQNGKKTESVSSGMYLIFLFNADSAARSLVDEQHKDDEEYKSSEVDYYSMKVKDEDNDNKEVDFTEYVRAEAEQMMKEYLYVSQLAEEKKISLTKDEIDEAKQMAQFYWYSYGLGNYYEKNGIAYSTYETYNIRQQLNAKIFNTLYGIGGEKGVKESDVKKGLKDNYVLADAVKVTLSTANSEGQSTPFTDDQKKEAKKKLTAYAKQINDGKTTFEEVYKVYNPASGNTSSAATSSQDDTPKPKDDKAVVYGSEDSSQPSDYFEGVQKLIKEHGYGHAAVLANKNETEYSLVVTADIFADSYYYDTYQDSVISQLYHEKYEDELTKASAGIKLEIDEYELDYLKPDRIDYSQSAAS